MRDMKGDFKPWCSLTANITPQVSDLIPQVRFALVFVYNCNTKNPYVMVRERLNLPCLCMVNLKEDDFSCCTCVGFKCITFFFKTCCKGNR